MCLPYIPKHIQHCILDNPPSQSSIYRKVPTQNVFTVMCDKAIRQTSYFSDDELGKIFSFYIQTNGVLHTCHTHSKSSLKLQVCCKEGGNIFKRVLKIMMSILNSYRHIQILLCRLQRETIRSLTIWVPEKWTEVIGLTHFNKPYGNYSVVHSMEELVQCIFQWLYCYFYQLLITNKWQLSKNCLLLPYK